MAKCTSCLWDRANQLRSAGVSIDAATRLFQAVSRVPMALPSLSLHESDHRPQPPSTNRTAQSLVRPRGAATLAVCGATTAAEELRGEAKMNDARESSRTRPVAAPITGRAAIRGTRAASAPHEPLTAICAVGAPPKARPQTSGAQEVYTATVRMRNLLTNLRLNSASSPSARDLTNPTMARAEIERWGDDPARHGSVFPGADSSHSNHRFAGGDQGDPLSSEAKDDEITLFVSMPDGKTVTLPHVSLGCTIDEVRGALEDLEARDARADFCDRKSAGAARACDQRDAQQLDENASVDATSESSETAIECIPCNDPPTIRAITDRVPSTSPKQITKFDLELVRNTVSPVQSSTCISIVTLIYSLRVPTFAHRFTAVAHFLAAAQSALVRFAMARPFLLSYESLVAQHLHSATYRRQLSNIVISPVAVPYQWRDHQKVPLAPVSRQPSVLPFH